VLPNVETKGISMKYEVKGLTSYGVYDGDRLLGSYESEKTAELIAEALNEEAGREIEIAQDGAPAFYPSKWAPDSGIDAIIDPTEPTVSWYTASTETCPSNGHDKETI
jgi:hypothetical protein